MNRIEQYQQKLAGLGVAGGFLAESDCDRILADYAAINQTYVACPYKPGTFLTKKSGNAGRTTVHVVGIGSVSFGDTPFEAKLNCVSGLLQYKYFRLDQNLRVQRPLVFRKIGKGVFESEGRYIEV